MYHVRLAGTKPYIADQNIIDDKMIAGVNVH
jgi:hypothetical protein